ncbi:N-acyl homoserine lactonase family protein [Falsirhodobacter sp. 1013]|uniref:N-acyl homoserine lactonase family protein n=1 Tax=Falsirhodobacter sp. 1013 TaxID=3417566 RepID=UPI003EB74B69
MIKVTAIQTGTVTIKSAQAAGREGRSAVQRKIDMLKDTTWTDPLPILCYLIEHPEGRFMVDTGDTWRNSVPGYLPRWNPFYTREVLVKVAPHEEVGERLRDLGIDSARDITAVLMTHMHHDHAGGIHNFPHARFIVPRQNWKVARSLAGMVQGNLPQRWPSWLKPELIEPLASSVGPFETSYPVTTDGRIVMVPTPGHAKGHMSVIVRDTEVSYFITGDATYDEKNLRADLVDGVTYDPDVSKRSQALIRKYAASHPTIILPAHDFHAAARLAAEQVYAT